MGNRSSSDICGISGACEDTCHPGFYCPVKCHPHAGLPTARTTQLLLATFFIEAFINLGQGDTFGKQTF